MTSQTLVPTTAHFMSPADLEEWRREIDEADDPERKEWMSRKLAEQIEYQETVPVLVPSCPPWCTVVAGHAYDRDAESGGWVREHGFGESDEVGDQDAIYWVGQSEYNHNGVISYGPVFIGSDTANEIPVATIRARAAGLLVFADRFEEIANARCTSSAPPLRTRGGALLRRGSPYSRPMEDHRCTAIDQGYRCQLLPHDDGQHVACVQFEIVRGGRDFASEYRAWGEPWTKGQPGIDPLRWAHTFPSAHELAA